jgi:plastocyanin
MTKPSIFRLVSACAVASAIVCGPAWAGSISIQVLDKEGKPAADAVVVVSPASRTPLPRATLQGPFIVTQERMQFVPAVTVVPVGTKVSFVNQDGWAHHVRGSAAGAAAFQDDATAFELRLEGKGDGKAARQDVSFSKVGPVLLSCHIHGSMRGHVFVTDSPWTAKTGADGLATLEDVPEGAASIRVWHADQLLDLRPLRVEVGGAPVSTTVKLDVVPRRRRI